jgi:DeoR/GlpR family transcriptional regulator of sugar metabolism
MTEKLAKHERQERILHRLKNDVSVRVITLAEQFGVTTETIRRDINELTDRGLVDRTYGGAVSKSLTAEPNIQERQLSHVTERQKLAAHAASMIGEGDVLMIDSGSTTYHFARALANLMTPVTILTNCLPIAQSFDGVAGTRIILCPGDYSGDEKGVYGQHTTAFLDRFQANKAIISAGGITGSGVSDADPEASWIKRKMIERSEQVFLLMNHQKLDNRMFDTVCPLDDIDDLVVDQHPESAIAQALGNAGIRIHVASERTG